MKTNNKKGPFIKKFKTRDNYYLYDVNSNNILRVNEILYEMVDKIWENDITSIINKLKHKYSISDIKKNYETIQNAKKENNLLSDHRPDISFGISSINEIKDMLSSGLNQLILELSERCNFRCKYCAYSGRYYYTRRHGRRDMSFETAKKAVDFFIERSAGNQIKEPRIGFYGGEPLLKFNLLRQIVDYVKRVEDQVKFRFTVTTNGTLLNKEIVEYFVKSNVTVVVSLDGPKNIHNRYRVFRNGQETFDKIIENLKKIKNFNHEYFKNNILFNVVLAPPYDFEAVIDFFYRNPFFEQNASRSNFSSVDHYDTSFFKDFNLEKAEKLRNKEIYRLLSRYKDSLIRESYKKLTIEKNLFDKEFYRIYSRSMKSLSEIYPPQGMCFPGKRRLFVNVDGKYFMCERVNCNYEIGDVDQGFNFDKIYYFFKKYEKFFEDCKYCWAIRLCVNCFNSIRRGENFNEQRKNELCKNNLSNIERNLIDFCEIREKKPHAFRPFEKIIVL